MLEQKQGTEQRRNKRYRLNTESYAIIKQDNYSEVAQLLDISKSGLSFLCINEGAWDKEPFFIDLNRAEQSFEPSHKDRALQNIPLRPLAYCTYIHEFDGSMNIMQRCGVMFEELTIEQKIKLNDFIYRNVAGVSRNG